MCSDHGRARTGGESPVRRTLRGAAYLLLVVAVLAALPDFYFLPQVVPQPYGVAGWYYAVGWWLHALVVGGTVSSLFIFMVCGQPDGWFPTPARILVWSVGLLLVGKIVFLAVLELRA
jgi:hypothetical protein